MKGHNVELWILSTDEARAKHPELFGPDSDDQYFNEIAAHGNDHWVDFWPDLVAIVLVNGRVFMSSNASEWWVKEHDLDCSA